MDVTLLRELFFDAVSRGSVEELENLIDNCTTHEREQVIEFVHSSNEIGETPLLLAVKGNHKEMVDFLTLELGASVSQNRKFVWQGICYEGITLLFVALVGTNKTSPFIIRSLIPSLPARAFGRNDTSLIHSTMSSTNTRPQKIDLLELIGAAYILEDHTEKSTEFGLACWKQAMLLRQASSGESAVPKDDVIMERIPNCFHNITEVATIEELDYLAIDPVRNKHLLKIQSLFVLRRILHRAHPIPSLYFLHHIFLIGCFTKVTPDINIMLFILESYHGHEWETGGDENHVKLMFSHMRSCFGFTLPRHPVPLESLLKTIWFAFFWDSKHKQPIAQSRIRDTFDWTFLKTLIRVLVGNLQQPSHEAKRCLSHYISLFNEHPKIIGRLYWHIYNGRQDKFNSLIGLLVEAGSNPNVTAVHRDGRTEGNTPLHCLLMQCHPNVSPMVIATIKLLVDAGAHLDRVNAKGESPLSLFKKLEARRAEKGLATIPELQYLFYSVRSLQYYSAQVVAKHLVKNHQELSFKFPRSIRSLIYLHVDC